MEDLKNLTKYPEFYALKQELLKFCDKMDSISDIDLTKISRVTLAEEIYGRRFASEQIKELFDRLGLITSGDKKVIDKTFE